MKAVFVDVDTQLDFVYPAGALYAPGAERVVRVIERLNRFAADCGCVVISTMDAHSEDDREFENWPPHCITGALGQRKPGGTLLSERLVVPSLPGEYSIDGARQILLEKQSLDCFTNPNLRSILGQLNAERYFVYGVVTEYCVRYAALGLLGAGERVEIVTDATQSLKEEDRRRTLDEIQSAGGGLTASEQILREFKC